MMRPFSASELLGIWEEGVGRMPAEQALVILAAAFPRVPHTRLGQLTVGQRDACLLHLRALTFGTHLTGRATCPACQEQLELAFEAGELLPADSLLPDPEANEPENSATSFEIDAYELTFRLPTATDLAALRDISLAQEQLLAACLLAARHKGKDVQVADLPPAVLQALTGRMGQAEPLADLSLAATCPACGHNWQILFDIVSYFWSEINAWSLRLMREVHSLASAYGWREADILAMSAWRRQRYLELIGL
jgi:hypothetical protein